MRPLSFRRRAVLAALALPLVLAPGCAGLTTLQSATAPVDLYNLTPKSTFDDSSPAVEVQLVVEEPTADASVNTDRIAVKPHPLMVQYFAGSRWVERAPLVVQRVLIESFENTRKVPAVGRSQVGLRADYVLVMDLREFQAVQKEDSPDALVSANVRLNIKIVKQPEGLIVGSRSFAKLEQARSNDMVDVVGAFDDALGKVMRLAVEWTLRRVSDVESNLARNRRSEQSW